MPDEGKEILAVNPPVRSHLHEREFSPKAEIGNMLAGTADKFGSFTSGQQIRILPDSPTRQTLLAIAPIVSLP